jgi:hypothetical protein
MRQLTTLALAAALLAPAAIPGAPPVAVTVRTNSTVVERFMGAGVQWDPY